MYELFFSRYESVTAFPLAVNLTTFSTVAAASESPAIVGSFRNVILHCFSLRLTTICSTFDGSQAQAVCGFVSFAACISISAALRARFVILQSPVTCTVTIEPSISTLS